VAALYSFLVDRFQATDFAGTLTINLLKVCQDLLFDAECLTNMHIALFSLYKFD
jgi:hypothetical protein